MVLLCGLLGPVLLVGFVLTGCSVEEPPEAQLPPIKRRQEVKTPAPETLFAKAEEEAYTYRSSGRRDPFKPLITPKKPVAELVESKVECPPLQEFEIPSLKLVGIVWGQMGRKAMLKAPNGRGYSIVENTLADAEEIVCNAGSHTETVKLRYRDFAKLAKPRVASFGLHVAKAAKPKRRVKKA